MGFSEKLEALMEEKDISQTKLSELTGIGKSSISQYVSGKNKPSEKRRKQIASALDMPEDYFEEYEPDVLSGDESAINMPIPLVAKLMGKSREWVTKGLQDGIFPWGYAVKLRKWSYFVSSAKFEEFTGIRVPIKRCKEG